MKRLLIFSILILFISISLGLNVPSSLRSKAKPHPVVLWHGMGDTCCFSFSMGRIKQMIENAIPGVYVYSVRIGDSEEADEYNGFFKNVNDQIAEVCDTLSKDPNLADGFDAVGFSQGGQFLRGYVERCNKPKVRNLISIGGQHQGVYGFPHCPGANYEFCELTRNLLDYGAYVSFVQRNLVQAEYWHDPFNHQQYVNDCVFLPDINNEGSVKNQTYKKNLMSLNNFVMTTFTEDTMVQPIESERFEFYVEGQDKIVLPLNQSKIYTEDWIGLKALDKQGKLTFFSVVGDHLKFTDAWFKTNIIGRFLSK